MRRMLLAVLTWASVSLLVNWALGGSRRNLGFSLFFGVVVFPVSMVFWWWLIHRTPQFSLRALLIAMTLLAVGLGLVCYTVR